MKKAKKRNKVLTLIILVLLLTIGFAVLSTTLKINGISTIGKNTWDIYWDNIQVTEGSVTPSTAAYIKDSAKTEIEYSVRFNAPGDFYEFTVDAVNNGTLDAIITEIDSKVNGVKIENANLPQYIKYSIKYADGEEVALNDLLEKKNNDIATRRKYRVRVEYDKDLVTNKDVNDQVDDLEYTFNYKVTYSQKTKDYSAKVWVLPEGKDKDTLENGDELCVKDQCFNYVKTEGNNVVLLAKYNLNIGHNPKGGVETFIQEEGVYGQKMDETCYGNVAFSADLYDDWDNGPIGYWIDGSTRDWEFKTKYGTGYHNNSIYDPDYDASPDFSSEKRYNVENYSIAYYVKKYKKILRSSRYNANVKEARILDLEEVLDSSIGCTWKEGYTSGSGRCPENFVTNTSSWVGTAADRNEVYYIYTYADSGLQHNYMSSASTSTAWGWGVRPVIVISKNDL